MRECLLLLAAAALGGCTAQVVERKLPRKGPVEAVGYIDAGNGEVRYSTEGWPIVIEWRRKTALRLIKKACLGLPYKINDEFNHQDVEVPYSQAPIDSTLERGHEHYRIAPFEHLVYECAPPPK